MAVYDSKAETEKHIEEVQDRLAYVCDILTQRGLNHDRSKLSEPEKSVFDSVNSRLKELTYGSPEYQAQLKELGVALDHHYRVNRHHPEHFGEEGIRGMHLIDLLEMLADWKAATLRMHNGSMLASLAHNRERFNLSDELYGLLERTARFLNWV